MPELDEELPEVQYGEKPPADWRNLKDEDHDPDDEELSETSQDVIDILGFDPLDDDEPEDGGDDGRDDAVWEESKHRRGQPGNKGQFGSGGGGASAINKESEQPKALERKEPSLSGPIDPDADFVGNPMGQQLEKFLYADPEDRLVLSYSNADTPEKTRAVLRHAFTTNHHLEAIQEAFDCAEEEEDTNCRKISNRLKQTAKAPAKLVAFVARHEVVEWSGAVRAITSIAVGEMPENKHMRSLVSTTIKIATMAATATVAGTIGELATPAALAAIATEWATHAVAEHTTKFSIASLRLVMRRRQDAVDESEGEEAMSVLLEWLADAVESTDLTEFFEKAAKALT